VVEAKMLLILFTRCFGCFVCEMVVVGLWDFLEGVGVYG